MDKNNFLELYKIDVADFDAANIDWQQLVDIKEHYENSSEELKHSVQLYANILQAVPGIHSTRWRIKDPNHLVAKLIRKKLENNNKYEDVSIDNYTEKVTDLIGIRALHLFKTDIEELHPLIQDLFEADEDPKAYIRKGDDTTIYQTCGLTPEEHPSSYRSVHYVFKTRPMKREIKFELQLRTIFEEGWSEIDHKVRYPNHSQDRIITGILAIFNRISGAADEFGSITKIIADEISQYKRENEESMTEMSRLLNKLTEKEKDNSTLSNELEKIRDELTKMHSRKSSSNIWSLSVMDPILVERPNFKIDIDALATLGLPDNRKKGK